MKAQTDPIAALADKVLELERRVQRMEERQQEQARDVAALRRIAIAWQRRLKDRSPFPDKGDSGK